MPRSPQSRDSRVTGLARSSGLLVLAAVVLGVILASPLALAAAANVDFPSSGAIDWTRVGNIGQAYGGVSAVLAGLALITVTVSLVLQHRQTRTAQIQAVRTMHMELFRMAYDHPELQRCWAKSVDVPSELWRQRTYQNLVFMYLSTGFDVGLVSERNLHRMAGNRFTTEFGREYWRTAAPAWRLDARKGKRRAFVDTVDAAYREAVQSPPLPEVEPARVTEPPARSTRESPRAGLLLLAGAAVTACAGAWSLRSRRGKA
ncbi:hypothetical protein SUDANB95_02507 [Actinosynnema sp. ALI-1.44]